MQSHKVLENSAESSRNCETPKIYVACLASYNAGFLHGRWVDVEPRT